MQYTEKQLKREAKRAGMSFLTYLKVLTDTGIDNNSYHFPKIGVNTFIRPMAVAR